ncbi:probable WRKY transcription factor protein 1 [Hydra vulgaris]|uniref:probable WRKY transcription factor protein 1 n=1 Tax=Hydra vulgaris TaxID=6087 RepID=UPI0032EA0B92
MLLNKPKTSMGIDTDTMAGAANTSSYVHATSKTYAQAATNNLNTNEFSALKNTILCKVNGKFNDNEILSAIEEAGYDKHLYGFQQIRNGSIIEIVMKNDKAKYSILEKGLNINGVTHQFYQSTPSRNFSKKVTISILGLPIEKSNFPVGKYLEELGYGKHIRTKPIFKRTPKNKTLYYSGIIVAIMDNLEKQIPRFINLNGYEVRAIYNGQKDVGRPQKQNITSQKMGNENANETISEKEVGHSIKEIQSLNGIITSQENCGEPELNKHVEEVENQTVDITTKPRPKTSQEILIVNEREITTNSEEEDSNTNNSDNGVDGSKGNDSNKDVLDDNINKDSNDNNSEDDNNSGDSNDDSDDNDEEISEEDDVEVPEEYIDMFHLEKVDYNWKLFKNFDRLNCSDEELKKFKAFKKYEWIQYEMAQKSYQKLENIQKSKGQLTPLTFEKMDSGEMYSYNMKEFKDFKRGTTSNKEERRYIACKKAEWEQRRKEHEQFHKDHETKQVERFLKKQLYKTKKNKN